MTPSSIAIIGIAGRFPGARTVSELWQNLRDGVELIRDRSDAELLAAGATREELNDLHYVKRASILDDVPMFDASFFGFSPRDASIMDPQHRHFLECAWEALEDAGHPPRKFDGSIGVFAGSGMNQYLIHNLLANRRLLESSGLFQLKQTGNDKDVLATRVSYQFDLRGPSINVQTACSTSLVAVHLACQSLLNFECDMALAGGVTIEIPHGLGYIHREGEILSRDGHCRAFDAESSGTVFGSGLGIVVLRRLEDALREGDQIHAVILGSAINNDGGRKVGYLAPSVEGQAEVIREALNYAGVSADDISYVEAHGTGTLVGDPIEVRALTNAFRSSSSRTGYCGIGSLKTNIGHLDAAAGVAGLIKTVLALKNAKLPPSLHFKDLNPHIELRNSPFFVNDRLTDWSSSGSPRRAGVTSLGIGGTNAHVIVEEAPSSPVSRETKPWQLLITSAKSASAADKSFANLITHIQNQPDLDLADIAFTSQVGRQAFAHRRAVVLENPPGVKVEPSDAGVKPAASGIAAGAPPGTVFMFTGQGSQHANMGRELYAHEPVFKEALDTCARVLQPHLGIDLLQALYPREEETNAAAARLNETWLTQPALFSIEYALARWWMSLGVEPSAMVGHSIGEYVAACLAGVFSLEDALAVVAYRGRSIFDLPAGSMVAVPLSPDKVTLRGSLSLAAVNNPQMCVVSGPTPEIEALERDLGSQSVACRRLHTSHAFHSAMMDPMLHSFEERLRSVSLQAPRIPYLSNVSGTWIRAEEATDPAYWARHIRQTVRFSDNLSELFRKSDQILIEVGPGNVLASLARMQGGTSAKVVQSLPQPNESISDLKCALLSAGKLWTHGVNLDFTALHSPGAVRRVSLPTYPFEHQRFWVEPDRVQAAPASSAPVKDAVETWMYRRSWKPAPALNASSQESGRTIIFRDALGLADRIAKKLKANKNDVIFVDTGSSFRKASKDSYTIRVAAREDYDALIAQILASGRFPERILHLWSVEQGGKMNALEPVLDRSFYSPLYLTQALGSHDVTGVDLMLVANQLQKIADDPILNPARAVLFGPARVTPLELPGIRCRVVDVDLEQDRMSDSTDQIVAELGSASELPDIAYRRGKRFVETLERLDPASAPNRAGLKERGVYLITGGVGGLGLEIAKHLGTHFHARVILVGRSATPPEDQWEALLKDGEVDVEEKDRLRKLIEVRRSAGGIIVAQADVTDAAEMRTVVAQAKQRFGTIDGVIHAAGVLDDGPLLLKSAASSARVLDPKVRGTLVLEEVLRDMPLSSFILFSSISSINPVAGQVDYLAANAFLDAFAAARGGNVTAINWDAWREVGMAARVNSPHPLVGERLKGTQQQIVFSGKPEFEKLWVCAEHRLKTGKSLLPGTAYLEMAAEALRDKRWPGTLEFQDVYFLAPLAFATSESKELRIQLSREDPSGPSSGAFVFSILAKEDGWIEHATGRISASSARPPAPFDLAAIRERFKAREIRFDDAHRTRQERYFDFGPRWRSLQRICIGDSEALAELCLPDRFTLDTSTFHMHPALLDMATGCSLYLIEGYENRDDLYLPFAYNKIEMYRPLPSKLFSHIRHRKNGDGRGDFETFDIKIVDEHGDAVAQIDGFTMRRKSDAATADDIPRGSSLPSVAQIIEIGERAGLLTQQGVNAFTEVLQTETPSNVVVSSHPIEMAGSPSIGVTRPASVSGKGNRAIEDALIGWFQELMGVETVALDDDFFDLGGHSLIAVRLFAKIKSTFKVDLVLSRLFEARTVRLLAKVLREELHEEPTAERKWRCLVPVQPNGSRVPFFFIHPVGGEILTYEPLSKALGPDQPFYAFRSLLASQEEIRQKTIEELASVYVEEMRAFLPEGPYIIGGHSFGGVVAYEMARQLHSQGVELPIVILLDVVVPGSRVKLKASMQLANVMKNLLNLGASYLLHRAILKHLYWQWKLRHRVQVLTYAAYRHMGRAVSPELRYVSMEEAHGRALGSYRFQPYPGQVHVVRATDRTTLVAIARGYRGMESISEVDDAALGWEVLAEGGVEVHVVQGHHSNMLVDPYVREVAEVITKLATSVQREAVVQ